jgi:hypothetical protein
MKGGGGMGMGGGKFGRRDGGMPIDGIDFGSGKRTEEAIPVPGRKERTYQWKCGGGRGGGTGERPRTKYIHTELQETALMGMKLHPLKKISTLESMHSISSTGHCTWTFTDTQHSLKTGKVPRNTLPCTDILLHLLLRISETNPAHFHCADRYRHTINTFKRYKRYRRRVRNIYNEEQTQQDSPAIKNNNNYVHFRIHIIQMIKNIDDDVSICYYTAAR